MKIVELVRHYDRDKCQHQPLSESLGPKLVQLMDIFGQLDAGSPGPALVARAQAALPGVAPGTMLRVLAQLRAVLRVAARDGLIPSVPFIRMPQVHDVVDCQITTGEAHLLLRHMRWTAPRWWPLALLLLHTGARLSEALRVGPEDMLPDGVRIRKPVAGRTKTVRRVVPYTRQLRAAVQGGLIIPHQPAAVDYATAKRVAYGLGSAIKAACRDLGLPEIRVHDLRHLFAAIVAENGGDLSDIATLLGHSNLRTTLRYRGLVQERAREILENV